MKIYRAKEIQDEAIVCRYSSRDLPFEGKPPIQPTKVETPFIKKNSATGVIVGLIILICILMGLYAVSNSSDSGGPSTHVPDNIDASIVCHDFVKDRLRSPTSAKFPNAYDEKLVR